MEKQRKQTLITIIVALSTCLTWLIARAIWPVLMANTLGHWLLGVVIVLAIIALLMAGRYLVARVQEASV